MSTLYIVTDSDSSHKKFFYKNNGTLLSVTEQELNSKAKPSKVICLLEGMDASIKSINYPDKINENKLRTLIPNIIEDDIVEDVESTSISFKCQEQKGKATVCLINKSTLQGLLGELSQHNLKPDVLTILSTIIPNNTPNWSILELDNQFYIKSNFKTNLVTDQNNIQILLEILSQEEPLMPIEYYTTSDQPLELPEKFVLNTHKVSLSELISDFNFDSESYLKVVDNHTKTTKEVSKKSVAVHFSLIASLLLCLTFGYLGYSHFTLKSKIKAQQAILEKSYFEIYPNAKAVISPKLRMQRDLKKLQGQDNNNFLSELSLITNLLGKDSRVQVNSISFIDEKFQIKLEAPNFKSIENLVSLIKRSNLDAKVMSTNKTDNYVTSILEVKGS